MRSKETIVRSRQLVGNMPPEKPLFGPEPEYDPAMVALYTSPFLAAGGHGSYKFETCEAPVDTQ